MPDSLDSVFASWRRVMGQPTAPPTPAPWEASRSQAMNWGPASYLPWFRFGAGNQPSASSLDFGDKLPAWGTGAGVLVKPPASSGSTPSSPASPVSLPGSDLTAETELEKAIDQYSGGDRRLSLAMRLGALVEGGNLQGGWGTGDSGQSHGPFQIYQGAGHTWADGRPVTVADSLDPWKAAEFMSGQYKAALAKVNQTYGEDIWTKDPRRAAMLTAGYAERPAAWGQNPNNPYPTDRVGWAWGELQKRGWTSSAGSSTGTPAQDQRNLSALSAARGYLGMKYGYGSDGTNGSIDCSALTQNVYRKAGVNLPRTAQQQFDATQRIDASQVKPGDLVFYSGTYNAGTLVTHVGIWLGDGQMLSATDGGVGQQRVDNPYWRGRLVGYGRAAA